MFDVIFTIKVECCGINGPSDWKVVTHKNELPLSCCKAFPVDGHCTETDAYLNGCFTLLEDKLQNNSQLLIWTGIGFAAVQVFYFNKIKKLNAKVSVIK